MQIRMISLAQGSTSEITSPPNAQISPLPLKAVASPEEKLSTQNKLFAALALVSLGASGFIYVGHGKPRSTKSDKTVGLSIGAATAALAAFSFYKNS